MQQPPHPPFGHLLLNEKGNSQQPPSVTRGKKWVLRFSYTCSMELPFSFLNYKIYNNPLYDWLFSAAIVIGSAIFARVVYWLFSKILKQYTKHTNTELDDLLIKRIDAPIALGIVLVGIRYALKLLHFPTLVNYYVHRGFVLMSALAVTWLITRIVRALIEYYLKQYYEKENSTADEQVILTAKRVSIIFIWAVGAIVGLNNAGFDVGALIAGLGIGGLAVALAAQDTVKNIIGGLIVFMDKPFRMGDIVKVKDVEGTVVYTGIRSTRIRTGAGRLVTIPNAQFTDSAIENITVEPSKRVVTYLQLMYETPSEKIDEAISILKTIVEQRPDVNNYDAIIYLERFSASSVDINFTYFIKKQSDIFLTQTEINKEVLRKFKAAGIQFAYPTQRVVAA